MNYYEKIQNKIDWIIQQIQCIKTGACIVCEHPVTSVNGKLGDVVLDGTEIELVDGGGVSVTQAISDLDSDLNNIVFPVTTVNGKGGDVVLDPDDLDDSETNHKFATADQLDHIAINTEQINALDDNYLALSGGVLTGPLTLSYGGIYDSMFFTTDTITFFKNGENTFRLGNVGGFYVWKNNLNLELLKLDSAGLLEVQSANFNKAVTGGDSTVPVSGVIDLSLSNHYSFTITQNTTFSFTNLPSKNMTFTIGITRGGTGSETYTIDNTGVVVKTANIEINETVGSLTEWWCKYYHTTNTITINAVTGFTTL